MHMKKLIAILLISFLPLISCGQTNKKTSALDELAGAPAASDEMAINDGGADKKILMKNLQNAYCVGSASVSSGVLTLDHDDCGNQKHTLSENVSSIAFTNVPTNGDTTFVLYVTQNGSSANTVAFDTITINTVSRAIKWSEGIAPLMTSTLGSLDVYHFIVRGGEGTPEALAFVGGQNFGAP